ncbi:MAG: hypothetical protein H6565_06575 [Lewinellaceae bacterium]|nr:hypothetical protein [Lewinellaceae bacterium]
MKSLLPLLLLVCITGTAQAQKKDTSNCVDVVYLRNGSVFRGQLLKLESGGDFSMITWNGVTITMPEQNIKRVVQRCKEGKLSLKPYDFKEKGLYNATRLGFLIGQDYFGENTKGYSIYHSVGWMLKRQVGIGVGVGVEVYNPDGVETNTYPIFVEARGYLKEKNVSPFYVVGAGWSLAGKNATSNSGYINEWSGGWLAKAQLGYRIGNNVCLYGGLSFQKKVRDWRANWGTEWGQDRILHKRFELGIGVII